MVEINDVAVIGGGVIGTSVLYELSHFQLKTVLLEKEKDICFGVSKANSGIVHGGFHYSAETTLKGKLELKGNLMFDSLQRDLGFAFHRCGILIAAFVPEEMQTVETLFQRGRANGVPGIELCSRERILELEPKLDASVCGGLYAPGGGVVEPYTFVFSMMRAAKENGAELKTEFKVAAAKDDGGLWEIRAADGRTIHALYAVNAAGLYADEVSRIFHGEEFKILPRKGEEYLLDRSSPARPSKVVFPVPSPHTKGVLVIPTAGGTTMIGPTAQIVEEKTDTATSEENRAKIFSLAKKMVGGISERDLITSFSGSRPVMEGNEDFTIIRSEKTPRFLQAAGIQSPGLTASPAIAEYIVDLLKQEGIPLRKKENYVLPEKDRYIRELSGEEADLLHKKDPAWTNIICRCEKISEAEIRTAIRQGHTTIDGIKFATRAGMGRCQGGFCMVKIMHIIAEETGIPMEEIVKRESGGTIIVGSIGGKEACK